jgi:hypothetical protein
MKDVDRNRDILPAGLKLRNIEMLGQMDRYRHQLVNQYRTIEMELLQLDSSKYLLSNDSSMLCLPYNVFERASCICWRIALFGIAYSG